ncbi:hypothetical protein LXL04_037878 [Taraxacum kok-saghyz]
MFNHVLGENLEMQLQLFITLTTEMSSAEIVLPRSEVNKKLLKSLPRSWDMNVSVIKKTKDLNKMLLAETMAVIKACDMNDKQRVIRGVLVVIVGMDNRRNVKAVAATALRLRWWQ